MTQEPSLSPRIRPPPRTLLPVGLLLLGAGGAPSDGAIAAVEFLQAPFLFDGAAFGLGTFEVEGVAGLTKVASDDGGEDADVVVGVVTATHSLARKRAGEVQTTNKPQAADLGLKRGAGDGNRTRALSLGITGFSSLDGVLTWGNDCMCVAPPLPGLAAVDRDAPPYLARIWHVMRCRDCARQRL